MLFNSYEFLFLFAPITFLGYYKLPAQWRVGWLLGASYLFYAYWDVRFLALIWFSTAVDFVAGWQIGHSQTQAQRKMWLGVSLLLNLGTLGFFKYYNFFTDSFNDLLDVFPELNIILPIGISFYTFQSMSYTIDIFRNKTEPTPYFFRFALYIVMFPQLIAGPIVRYTDIEARLQRIGEKISPQLIQKGIVFFVLGLAKKVVIADQFAFFVNHILRFGAEDVPFFQAWLAILSYTFQLYFDFSGYSNMAIGLGYMLGFEFPRNFNLPYIARNISDFWRRWHITLSTWLRDYLFISLGGSKGTVITTAINLMITMFLGGLWHGAAWTFVLWGVYHGAALMIFHAWRYNQLPAFPVYFARGFTFLVVVIGWVIFRSDSLGMAADWMQGLLGYHGVESLAVVWDLPRSRTLFLLLGIGFTFGMTLDTWDIAERITWRTTILLAILFVLSVMLMALPSPFLYFQF